jgi:hypothetical protein
MALCRNQALEGVGVCRKEDYERINEYLSDRPSQLPSHYSVEALYKNRIMNTRDYVGHFRSSAHCMFSL